jgi:hypothetical protein
MALADKTPQQAEVALARTHGHNASRPRFGLSPSTESCRTGSSRKREGIASTDIRLPKALRTELLVCNG